MNRVEQMKHFTLAFLQIYTVMTGIAENQEQSRYNHKHQNMTATILAAIMKFVSTVLGGL
jgi:hypothetical protein